MKIVSWLGCAAIALVPTLGFGQAQNDEAPLPPAVQADNEINRLNQRIEQDNATIRGLARRIEKLERVGLRAPEHEAEENPGYHYFGSGSPAPDEPMTAGLRAPERQLAQIEAAPSDVAPPTNLVAQSPSPAPAPASAPAQLQVSAPAQPTPMGQFEVSPEAAQHALERALVQTGALLLRPGQFELVPSVSYQVNELSRPDQIVLTGGGSVLVAQDLLRNTLVQSQMLGRVGLPWEAQLEVALSYDIASSSVTSQVIGSNLASHTVTASGLGDSSVSLIKQVTHEGEWLPSVFVSGTANIGQIDNGLPLGTGFDWFKAAVVAVKRQDPLVFTAGFSYQTNLASHGILPGDQFVPSVGLIFALSPETSIQAIQQIAFVNNTKFHGVTVPGSSQIEGIFQAGILSILAPGVVINLTAAVAETPQAPDLTVQLSLPIRFDSPL